MLDYIQFYTHIWNDKRFRALSNSDSRILFIYLFANKNINLSGIYELDKEECMLKSRLNNNYENAFKDIVNNKMIEWDEKLDLIWVINRFKLIKPKSAKVIVGVIEELNTINHIFKEKFLEQYKEDLAPYWWRLKGQKVSTEEICTEDFILNAAKIYNDKKSLKTFMMNRGIAEQKIDMVIARILPQWKAS